MRAIIFVILYGIATFTNAQEFHFYEQYETTRTYERPVEFSMERWELVNTSGAEIIINPSQIVVSVLPTHFSVPPPLSYGSQMANDGTRFLMSRKAKLNSDRYTVGSGSNQYYWDGSVPNNFETPTMEAKPMDGNQPILLDTEFNCYDHFN